MYSRCLLLSLPAAPLTFAPHNKRAPLNALYGVKVGVLESCHLIGFEDFAIPQSPRDNHDFSSALAGMDVFKSLYVVCLAVNNSITFKEMESKRYNNYYTLLNFGGRRVWAGLHMATTTYFILSS